MRQIEHFAFLDTTPEVAYDYVTTLKHWCDWYPGTIAIEGQIYTPSKVGDTVTESVKVMGLVGQLHWITIESVRPSRFAIETASVEMPLMRRARMRITYALESATIPRGHRTRFTRTFEYGFTGVARVLDRVYIHGHLCEKAAQALTNLERIVAHPATQDSIVHAG